MKKWTVIVLCFVLLTIILLSVVSSTQACPTPVIDLNWLDNFWRVVNEYNWKLEEYQKMLNDLKKYSNILNMIKIPSFLTNINQKWDETYKKAQGFKEMDETGYAEHLKKIDQETSNALHKAADAQATLDQIESDQVTLIKLMNDSAKAEGEMQAVQITNQIGVLQTFQLMRMQEIMAASYRAEALYYEAQLQEKLARQAYEEKNRIQIENPILKATGSGLPLFLH